MDKQPLIDIIKANALQIKPEGEYFTLKSGKKSRYYLDIRKITLSSNGLGLIIDNILRDTNRNNVLMPIQAIGGPCVGADPIVGGLLAVLADLNPPYRGFLVRPEQKGHGNPDRVIGSVRPGDRCLLIEDVTTTGISSINAIDAVSAIGGQVTAVISVVDRLDGAAEEFHKRGIVFLPILSISDIITEN